jgi:hypothetical protein
LSPPLIAFDANNILNILIIRVLLSCLPQIAFAGWGGWVTGLMRALTVLGALLLHVRVGRVRGERTLPTPLPPGSVIMLPGAGNRLSFCVVIPGGCASYLLY